MVIYQKKSQDITGIYEKGPQSKEKSYTPIRHWIQLTRSKGPEFWTLESLSQREIPQDSAIWQIAKPNRRQKVSMSFPWFWESTHGNIQYDNDFKKDQNTKYDMWWLLIFKICSITLNSW